MPRVTIDDLYVRATEALGGHAPTFHFTKLDYRGHHIITRSSGYDDPVLYPTPTIAIACACWRIILTHTDKRGRKPKILKDAESYPKIHPDELK
jgi:hypothetical protein